MKKMLKRLKFAEWICHFAAAICGVLALITAKGANANKMLALLLIAGMILLAFIATRFRKRINAILLEEHQKLPVNAVKATVVKRRVGHRLVSAGKSGVRSGPPMYYVTFEKESGTDMELYVPRDVYLAAQEGKTGVLRYKGDEFISFD